MSPPAAFSADCETVVRALWDYLDRELDERDLAAIDAHLAACEHCRAHAAFEQRLIEEIRSLRTQHAEPGALRARLLDVLRRTRSTDPER